MNLKKILIIIFLLFIFLGVFLWLQKKFFQNDFKSQFSDAATATLLHLGFYPAKYARPLTPIRLKNMDDQEVYLSDFSPHWQLINFGYMFCPDICPINLRLLSEIETIWAERHPEIKLQVTHITFDPKRDTPDRLHVYLEHINPNIVGLSGELVNIHQLAKQVNFAFVHGESDEYGNYFIAHSDSIALLNPRGQYMGLFKGPYDKEKMLKVLAMLTSLGP